MCVIRRHFWWVRADSAGNIFFSKYAGLSAGSQQSGGKRFFSRNKVARPMGPSSQGGNDFFHELWWPVRWVPAVRWRNNYFPCNKEALPCGCRGPSCQPLHVQYSSDGIRSLTTLTMPRREYRGDGRRRGLGRGRRGAGEDATVDAHVERSTRVHLFGYAAVTAE